MAVIIAATTPSHLRAVSGLFREYEQFLQVDLCFQHFEAELAGLPGPYAAPKGTLLLALADGAPVGCVAMRPLEDRVCEMKRLYVCPAHLGLGIGRELAESIIACARRAGYARMRLDTLEKLKPARALYRRLGFRRCPAYYVNPLPGVIYLELKL